MSVEQVLAASRGCRRHIPGRTATACGPNTSLFITSEKPRMALSGVRSSWLMVARKRDLARFGLLGAPARLVGVRLRLLELGDQLHPSRRATASVATALQ